MSRRRTSPASLPGPLKPVEPDQANVSTSLHTGHATGSGSPNPQVEVEGSSYTHCTGSVSGHAQNDRSGRCAWCGWRVDPPCPMPDLGRAYRTELDLAYRQFYDPDWGTSPYDV